MFLLSWYKGVGQSESDHGRAARHRRRNGGHRPEHQQKDDHNHGTHPPRPKHLTLKLFIAKHDDGAEKKKESTKKKLQAGPPKPDSGPILTSLNIGGLRGIIAAITGGATGNNNFMAQRATGGSGNLRHKKQQQIKHFY